MRVNINRVRQNDEVVIKVPTKEKEIVVIPPSDYLDLNKNCGHTVSRLNEARAN